MKVTRDVIVDLWPSYETGLASADSRALVEEFLAGDPELREQLRASDEALERLLQPPPVTPPREMEKAALDRIHELARLRTYFFVLAVVMTASGSMLRQYRWVSLLLAIGSGLVCAELWMAETRPRLAALTIGPAGETRTEARFRFWRQACVVASFATVVAAVVLGRRYGPTLLAGSLAFLAGWLVLAFAGRGRR